VPDTVRQKHSSYIDLALTESCEILGCDLDTLLTGGYTIETAMDSEAQSIAENAFKNDAYFPMYGEESSEGALVLIDAKTGGVSAIVGGRDSSIALGFNRATRIRRQPGSAIKPILVYAPALEAGCTAASMLLDDATDFGDYTPRNASGRYAGWITMREAVKKSLNLPAVSLFRELGVQRCKTVAARFGISFDVRDDSLTLALGGFTYGVSPYRLCGAYAALAAGGVYTEPYVVTRITDRAGTELYRRVPERTRILSEGNAFILTSLLTSVVKEGTASLLSELPFSLAAKTGTVGDETGNRDIWLCCYNPDYAAVVWMGFDDAAGGRCLPRDSGGGTYPAMLLSEVFTALYPDGNAPSFTVPESVVSVTLDAATLKSEHVAVLANGLTPKDMTFSEYFVRGTEPTETTAYWQIPDPPTDFTAVLTDDVTVITFTPPSRYMQYRLYREDSSGFSILLATFENAIYPVRYSDPVGSLNGDYAYYIVPVHPSLLADGEPLCGRSSGKRWITVWHSLPFLP
jgi:Membrane carboxypeptidase (penicillin-binding protein)